MVKYTSCGKLFKKGDRYWVIGREGNWVLTRVASSLKLDWRYCGSTRGYGGGSKIPSHPRFCEDCYRRNGFEW